MKKKIVVIPGDGIGGEITDAAVKVLKKTAAIYHLDLSLDQKMAGGTAYDACGSLFPRKRWKQPKTPMRSFLVP